MINKHGACPRIWFYVSAKHSISLLLFSLTVIELKHVLDFIKSTYIKFHSNEFFCPVGYFFSPRTWNGKLILIRSPWSIPDAILFKIEVISSVQRAMLGPSIVWYLVLHIYLYNSDMWFNLSTAENEFNCELWLMIEF